MSAVRRGSTGKPQLLVCKMSENAKLPTRANPQDAGYDLYSAQDVIIPAHGRCLVKTNIAVKIPDGHYGRVAPRSSLAVKHSIDVAAGVVDRGYRGDVGVALVNHSAHDYLVETGDRIAQLIIEKCASVDVVSVDSLNDTARGSGGFGSTGTK